MLEHRSVHYSGHTRAAKDFYATPEWVTEALLRHVRLRGPIWEPCCGTGAISEVLSRQGYTVVSTDIADYAYGTPGIDVLACRAMPGRCRSLVTNPPYGDTGSHKGQDRSPAAMLSFVRHALMLAETAQGGIAKLAWSGCGWELSEADGMTTKPAS
jgi:tRNA G10  N-methylase Trm11